MSSLDPLRTLPPLKSFALTHILYDPSHPLSIPLTLLSLSPIFLFVSYFTLLIWTRRLTILFLGIGSIGNEIANLLLKRVWKADRPWKGFGEVGDGYGMPSSHSQAAGFLAAWGIGYALTLDRRRTLRLPESKGKASKARNSRLDLIRSVRSSIFLLGLITWSASVAYSRIKLHYHSPIQVIAGYLIGMALGASHFLLTEATPLYYPNCVLGRIRSTIAYCWEGVGGVSSWDLGTSDGGWGEGWLFMDNEKGGAKRE